MYIRFFSFCEERYVHALFIHIKESDFLFSRKHSGKEISVKCCSLVKICAHWVSNYSGKVPFLFSYDPRCATRGKEVIEMLVIINCACMNVDISPR